MSKPVIVIATPHVRGDLLELNLRARLPECQIVRIRTSEELQVAILDRLAPDWVFFPHWSWIIPKAIHEHFRCVIFHMTDLPYGRGGSPLQNLIVRGHTETVLCALKCIDQLDAGPVYLRRSLSLNGTAEQILQRASDLTLEMVCEIYQNSPFAVAQEGEPVLFQRRQPEDGNLVTADGIKQTYDFIRMLDADGYPRAYLEAAGLRVEFSDPELSDGKITARVLITEKKPRDV